MLDKLKADFDAIIELVNKTPPALQEMAFKMILEQWFSANTAPKPSPAVTPAAPGPGGAGVTAGEGLGAVFALNHCSRIILNAISCSAGGVLFTSSMIASKSAFSLSSIAPPNSPYLSA